MKYRTLIFIMVASIALAASALGGEISLQEYHMAVTLPDGWQQKTDQRPGILVRAETDSGRLRFMMTSPPIAAKPQPVQDAAFQDGVKRSLADHGFPKIVRGAVIKVAGSDAYLCEAAQEGKPHSMIQLLWFHEGHAFSLVFLSLAKPFKDVPDIQKIIDSVKTLPKS